RPPPLPLRSRPPFRRTPPGNLDRTGRFNLLRERLLGMLRQPGSQEIPAGEARLGAASHPTLRQEDFRPRHSNGLDQFFSYIKGESGLSILDLAGANQANVSFITNLGHRIYSEDFLRGLRVSANGDGQPHLDAFLSQNLNHEEASF